MNTYRKRAMAAISWRKRVLQTVQTLALSGLVAVNLAFASGVEINQKPLIAGEQVPGNLILTPSVEWPTVVSLANLGNYDPARTYAGYFDAFKCYRYQDSATEADRHFYPHSITTNRLCGSTAAPLWSGNFLNWAATQTIDPFRKALTGGLRVRDTPTETFLEKARHTGQGGTGIYPNRRYPTNNNSTNLLNATPFNANWINVQIQGLGNRMRFRLQSTDMGATVERYDGSANFATDRVYELTVRVKVCDASVGLEPNCVEYSQGHKPEGLIQRFSNRLRYAIFGYQNDSSITKDGAPLRSNIKFVGDEKFDPNERWIPNPNREWDPVTGVLLRNPDPQAAEDTGGGVADSGVINYLNKFGQMTTFDHKSIDPVSEMYYAALRYIKNQGPVQTYNAMSADPVIRYRQADGFPVVTDWEDPYQYWCQPTAILGIGDANTHRDKNLPGNLRANDEPAPPNEVTLDTSINVRTLTAKVASLEGITINTPFTGRENSAYIAGMAYYANTNDLRPNDLQDRQTATTHWVDVREAQVLEGRARNQYWLAAKYGGFRVPEGFNPDSFTGTLPLDSWHTSGDVLSTGDRRPDNFYVASEADRMVSSLEAAFERIVADNDRSGASLTANSTRLEAGTVVYQSLYRAASFEGDLLAYNIDPVTGSVSGQAWRASSVLPAAASRNIKFHDPTASAANRLKNFTFSNLNSAQKTAIGNADIVDYLRGVRTKEAPAGTLRPRQGLLGSIVNSQPVLVGPPNPLVYSNQTFTGSTAYATFASANASRVPTLYVGANDGMLHGFRGDTGNVASGRETFAFIPNAVILDNLKDYASADYQHRYFVDGELTVADVYFGGSGPGSGWQTVLVGTLGRGGKGMFALNVTDPSDIKILWEKDASSLPALGNNLGKPIIAQVADGEWRVIVGNGPNSVGDKAQLVSLDVETGDAVTVDTGVGSSNGLSAPFLWDSNADGFSDTAYAGDLKGNLWRFSGLGGTPSVTKVFQATDGSGTPQPITASPLVGKNPADGAVWIFFGTGQYLNLGDVTSDEVQTWYGLTDGGLIGGRASLAQRSVLADFNISEEFRGRVIQEGTALSASQRGWYIDLPADGERMVLPNRFRGAVLIGTSRIPDASDLCAPTGRGFVMTIDPFTGGRLNYSFLDVNLDGFFNDADLYELPDGTRVPVSGLGVNNAPYNPIFTGNVMQFNREDGQITSVLTQVQTGNQENVRRTSWREIRQP